MPLNNHPEIKAKSEKTSMDRYNVKRAAHASETRKKAAETLKNRSDKDREQSITRYKTTCLERYAVENVMQCEQFKNAAKNTRLSKYGYEHVLQHPEISLRQVENSKKTCLKKYGVTNYFKTHDFRYKFKETSLKLFGCEHPMQNVDVYHHYLNQLFKYKDYIWRTGEVSRVQGNEPIVLDELEQNGYGFNDIFTSPKNMPEIWYSFEGTEHRYFPDIFIPKENLIIEVKSLWTFEVQKEKNLAKFDAVKIAGFNFKLEIR